MSLRMEPGQTYNTWIDFKEALDEHCKENKVVFNISNAKTVEQANNVLKKKPYFDIRLKYASIILVCKHYGSYKSSSSGLRPKQRSYKINCKAYISVSACRKENYLIIRDSYHIHSHPCSEEIYNSYPEVRRMTREERKMVGTLMELGVPTAQIKNAVGKHVTPKDLQNAKTHIKAVKLGLKKDEPNPGPRRRKTFKELEKERKEARLATGEVVSDSDKDEGERDDNSSSSSQNAHSEFKNLSSCEGNTSRDEETAGYTVTIGEMDPLEVSADPISMEECSASSEKDSACTEMGGLSGLLAAAGLNSDSVVLTVNNQVQAEGLESGDNGVKNSYTVTVSLPDGDVTHTGSNLQELLKGLPLGKIIAKSSSPPLKVKTEELVPHEVKSCTKCGGYISPLDGHNECLTCLGPEHIHEHDCEHCRAMTQEQFNIRRKKMVALRMKALKEMRRKRKNEYEHQDEPADSDSDYSPMVRKSKRVRKPKDYGPDIAVEDSFVLGGYNDTKSQSRSGRNSASKLSTEDEKYMLLGQTLKAEPLDDFSSNFSYDEYVPVKIDQKVAGVVTRNTQRFDHILDQTKVFEDVVLTETGNGSLCFTPETSTVSEFQKLAAHTDLPAIPPSMMDKYTLSPKFESKFCSDPPPLIGITDPGVQVMGAGLVKLAKNAAAQTRVAVYDKLFTRLGVGMADEALTILSELYGKVTEVTEISQEDLTNSLQTALDTIQALKDVLEELGIMSKDALVTASHQRSISINSLNAARKSIKSHRSVSDEMAPRRSKFLPFAKAKVSPQKSDDLSTNSAPSVSSTDLTSPAYKLKQLAESISSGQVDPGINGLPVMALTAAHEALNVTPVASTSFVMSGKEFTMTPLSMLQNKDGIIELHVMKDGEQLLGAGETTEEEIIHTE
ncbi:unnamed protein product [Lymnaea stagnalis]|uniref:ZSWIM3 N-terminal domain-containing protein n=1 Tax=Lymnaea stagnalis TaxID=6523 RepID=A0AAV2I578_LYMST